MSDLFLYGVVIKCGGVAINALASSALNVAEIALSADSKLALKSEDKYHKVITVPIARNMIV